MFGFGPLDGSFDPLDPVRDSMPSKNEEEAKKANKMIEDLKRIQPELKVIDDYVQKHMYDLNPRVLKKWLKLREYFVMEGGISHHVTIH